MGKQNVPTSNKKKKCQRKRDRGRERDRERERKRELFKVCCVQYEDVHVCIHIHIYSVCIYIHTCIYMYTCIYVHTYILSSIVALIQWSHSHQSTWALLGSSEGMSGARAKKKEGSKPRGIKRKWTDNQHARTIQKKNAERQRERDRRRERDVHGWFSPLMVISVHLGQHVFLYALEPHAIFIASVLYSNT